MRAWALAALLIDPALGWSPMYGHPAWIYGEVIEASVEPEIIENQSKHRPASFQIFVKNASIAIANGDRYRVFQFPFASAFVAKEKADIAFTDRQLYWKFNATSSSNSSARSTGETLAPSCQFTSKISQGFFGLQNKPPCSLNVEGGTNAFVRQFDLNANRDSAASPCEGRYRPSIVGGLDTRPLARNQSFVLNVVGLNRSLQGSVNYYDAAYRNGQRQERNQENPEGPSGHYALSYKILFIPMIFILQIAVTCWAFIRIPRYEIQKVIKAPKATLARDALAVIVILLINVIGCLIIVSF